MTTIDYSYLQNLLRQENLLEALRCAVALMTASRSTKIWFELSHICLLLGEKQCGIDGLAACARQYAEEGNLPMAIVAIRTIDEAGGNTGDLKRFVAELYGRESKRLRHRAMPIPPLPVTVEEKDLMALDLDREFLLVEAKKVLAVAKETAKLENGLQEKKPPLPYFPLFSSLTVDNFQQLAECFTPRRFYRDETIIRQGEPARDFFLIASGEVKVFVADRSLTEAGRTTQMKFKNIANLGPGTFIGEMGIVARVPRSASAQAICDGILLVAPIEAIEELSSKIPQVADVIVAYCEVRLLENVMTTSPILLPIDSQQRAEALKFFRRLFVPAGETIIREGEPAKGIYVIVSGEAGVTKMAAELPASGERESLTSAMIYLTTLVAGDVVGEISTIMKKPATATVHAVTDTTLLFLPAERFLEFTRTYPEVFQRLYEIVVRREEEIADILRSSSLGESTA